jgi:hypothetical protein
MSTLLTVSMLRMPSRLTSAALRRAFRGAGAAAVASGLLAAASSAPAQAQGFGGWFGPRQMVIEEPAPAIPAPEIYRRLLNRGYQLNSAMQRNGGVYLADVVDARGQQQRLVIDAYRGRVLQAFAYGPPRPAGLVPRPDGYRAGPAYASREPMPPQAALPGQDPRDPHIIPGLGPQRHVAEPKQKRRSKTATREVAPKETPAAAPAAPSEATAPPRAPEPAQAASPPPSQSTPTASVPAKAAIEPAAPAPKSAPKPAAATASSAPVAQPKPAVVPTAPSAKPENKPGYANGVPINPLD